MKCSGGSSMSLGHPVSHPHLQPRAAWDHPPLPEGGPILCLPPRFPKAGGSYSTCDVYWNNTFQLKTPQAKGEERERGGAEPKHRLRKDPMREAWEGARLLRAGRRLRWVGRSLQVPGWRWIYHRLWGRQNEFSVPPDSQRCPFPSTELWSPRLISPLAGGPHILSVCGLCNQPIPGPSLLGPFALEASLLHNEGRTVSLPAGIQATG